MAIFLRRALANAADTIRLTGQMGHTVGIELGFFEVVEDLLGPIKNTVGKAGQPRDLNSVALVGTTGQNLCEGR